MKSNFLVLLFVLFVLSCKTKKVSNENKNIEKEVNYIPYYLKVFEAIKSLNLNKKEESFLILDSLFNEYKPIETLTVYEMDIYCKLAYDRKKYNGTYKFIFLNVFENQ